MRPAAPRVAVVGAGWAGCTAALTLAEAGVAVTLYEASRTLGGRARAVELDGRSLDNGQHILLGAYQETLGLIEQLHPPRRQSLWRLPLNLTQPPDFALACPSLPAPLHLLAGLLGAKGLNWTEKLAAARWASRLLSQAEIRDPTVSQLTRDQPERANRLLWHPLCVSALNTTPDRACAQVFRNVIRDAFGGSRHHSDLLLPREDLSTLLPGPAATRLRELDGEVRTATRVTGVTPSAKSVTLATRDETATYSHVVLAVAPQHLATLVAPVSQLQSLARATAAYRYEPIATGYVQYDSAFRLDAPLFALGNGPAQFVFDRGQSHGQAGLLAFVVSAAGKLSPHWLDEAEAQLRRIAQPGAARWRRSIVEKQATYACEPGLTRPPVATAHPRVFLAGDYTAGPYPATLESATRSGLQSARSLLEKL